MKSCAPLHTSVLRKDAKWLKRYVEQKGDLELKDMNGNTALHHASLLGQSDLVHLLLSNGANVFATNILGYTPLHKAALSGDVATVEQLVAAKSNVLSKTHVSPLYPPPSFRLSYRSTERTNADGSCGLAKTHQCNTVFVLAW